MTPPDRTPLPPDLREPPSGADLLAHQRASFERFLQADTPPDARLDEGLQGVLRSVFPMRTEGGGSELTCARYLIERPRHDERECLRRALSYAAPLKLVVDLFVYDEPDAQEYRPIRDIKEQEVYVGELPLLTRRGTVIVDGVERVLSPRRVPSPGVRFAPGLAGGPEAIVTSTRGVVLRLTAYSGGSLFADVELPPWAAPSSALRGGAPAFTVLLTDDGALRALDAVEPGGAARRDITAAGSPAVLVKRGATLGRAALAKLRAAGCAGVPLSDRDLASLRVAADVPEGGATRATRHTRLRPGLVQSLHARGVRAVQAFDTRGTPAVPVAVSLEGAEAAAAWFDATFEAFEIGPRGRAVLDRLSGQDPWDNPNLHAIDLRTIARHLDAVRRGERALDPVDDPRTLHLWGAGELLAAHAWGGLARVLERSLDRMHVVGPEVDTLMPHDLIDAKALAAAFRALLGDARQCPPLDDANPLAVVHHVRCVAPDGAALPIGTRFDASGAPQPVASGVDALPVADALAPLRALDDAARAEAAARAQREALPLLAPEAPRVGTGLERAVADAAGAVVRATRAGRVAVVDEATVIVWPDALDAGAPQVVTAHAHLHGAKGAPQGERVVVAHGARVAAGDVLVAASAVVGGELALGRNVAVAFVGDAPGAVVAARAVDEGWFTAARVRTFECDLRDTVDGPEEHAAVPAIVATGASVAAGDLLVARRTPDGRGGWTDTSLRVPDGVAGVVRHVHVFARPGHELPPGVETVRQGAERHREAVFQGLRDAGDEDARRRMLARLDGVTTNRKVVDERGAVRVARGAVLTRELLDAVPTRLLYGFTSDDPALETWLWELGGEIESAVERARAEVTGHVDRWMRFRERDALPSGVRERVRVTIESRRALAVGDRLADRHGVVVPVRAIVADDAMPRRDDGSAVDVALPAAEAGAGTRAEASLGATARDRGVYLRVPVADAPAEAATAGDGGVLYLMRLDAAG